MLGYSIAKWYLLEVPRFSLVSADHRDMNKPSVGFEAEYRDWTTYAQRVIRVNSSPYLYVLKTGQLHFQLGDIVHKLTPDCVCWWPSGVTTRIENRGTETQGHIIRLRRSGFATHLEADREGLNFCDRCERYVHHSSPVLPLKPSSITKLKQTIRQMGKTWAGSDQFRGLKLKAHGMSLLTILANDEHMRAALDHLPLGNHDARMAALINWMEDHLSEPICLNDMAAQVDLSRSRFTEVFRQYCGRSPQDYLRRMRVARACHFLRYHDASITDICFRSGFGSLARFHAAFQEIIGMPPAKWRTANKSHI